MRQLLATIGLIIFFFQIVPVKELGKLLSSGQMTEEIQNNSTAGNSGLNEEVHKKLFIPYTYPLQFASDIDASAHRFPLTDEALVKHLGLEVPTPPPNV